MQEKRKARETQEEFELRLEKQKGQKDELAQRINDCNMTFSTAHGMRTLRWMMEICGFHDFLMNTNKAVLEVNRDDLVYNEGRRSIYVYLRRHIKPDVLSKVENKGLQRDEEIFE